MGKRSLGILLTAALLVLAACDGGGGAGQGNASGPPRHGGSVTFGLAADLPSLDPLAMSDDADQSVADGIYDPLIARGGSGGLVPWLADSWKSSADLRTWTLHLHRGVKFQDGTPFDAGAVVFNIERHMDPRNRSLGLTDTLLIGTVEAVDGRTVAITLKSPWADFPQVLAGPIGLMASPTAISREGANFGRRPVGTGPFVFKEWVTGDHITATRNRAYWKPGYPYLDSVTWRPIPDPAARYASLRSGRIDVLQVANPGQVVDARKDAKLKVLRYAGDGATFAMMNMKAPPFDDLNARLAIAYATNRTEIVDRVGRGTDPVATGPFPSGSTWNTRVAGPSYDVSRAKAALRAYGRPLSFQLDVASDPISRQYGQVLQAQWKKVGIDAQLVPMDQATLVQAALGRKFQLEVSRYGDWFDPDRYLFSAYISKGSVLNYPGYANPAVDAALIAGRATSDPAARRQAYGVVQRAIARDVPLVWLNYDSSYAISDARVQNLNTISSSITKPSQVWVSA